MKARKGPYPGPAFRQHMSANDPSPMMALVSGELTANISCAPVGAANIAGTLSKVWISLERSGKDDTNPLSVAVDVKINGTTCLTTSPAIEHISGEASTNKTTKVSGESGITEAVIDTDANSVSLGDVITYDATVTRTSTPTTEMRSLVIAVEIDPA